MRLTKIKLAGFKSFVDPTTIPIPSNLVGIIGPNGCGKSNTIDAVRWVMGESSAKNLRGDSMADVIFNGSTSRKPVGQASVEMMFDNSEGRAGGQYAQYNEISVRRLVTRDGQSNYYLNGTKCRRRDITDLFLGTGLGPRSYSIIEQGMISRLIEARPEDLRIFLEEAAGISKYKERRRETENRIRHTRENLDRLNDLRDELDKQLSHLHRQAKTAERYKELKEEERRYRGQLYALRWRRLDEECQAVEVRAKEGETQVEVLIAQQRSVESKSEALREASHEKNELFNQVQGRFYGHGSDIARIEQKIQHLKERRQQLQVDLEQLERNYQALQGHQQSDREKIDALTQSLEECEAEYEERLGVREEQAEILAEAESRMQVWQERWEQFNQHAAEPAQQAQVERTRLQQLEQSVQQSERRLQRLDEELAGLSVEQLAQEVAELEVHQEAQELEANGQQEHLGEQQVEIQRQRDENNHIANQLDELRSKLQRQRGRQASLEALQQAALGKERGETSHWLAQQGLGEAKRLAQGITVNPGWERAVECVLGNNLQAVCVDSLESLSGTLGELQQGSLTLFEGGEQSSASQSQYPKLIQQVSSEWSLQSLLGSVYCASDLPSALQLRSQLQPHESVITQDGLWFGPDWLRVVRDEDEQAGVLQREKELKALQDEIALLQEQDEALQTRQLDGRESLQALEELRETLQKALNHTNRELADIRSQLSGRQARLEQRRSRIEAIQNDREELHEQILQAREEHGAANHRLSEALAKVEELGRQREQLSQQREQLRGVLEQASEKARSARDLAHELELRMQSMRSTLHSTEQGLGRMRDQLDVLGERRGELMAGLETDEELELLKEELEEKLQLRVEVEEELAMVRGQVDEIEHNLRELNGERIQAENDVQERRTSLEQLRINAQELKVRRQTMLEKIHETGYVFPQLFDEMPEQADEEKWQQEVERIESRITRLGPINLAAISEYEEQSERKRYLDEQNDDLIEALETLEAAIAKIDRETRARFKETFEKVNSGLQTNFPKLFGGGSAYLELTGDDLLNTGVTVMARPPGKRNSTIHLLSGGEKALTAVALVFSIFELNPAPFCMLDEVDAPLDEANVGRFCKMVEEMSEHVQFIFISHNKATMEMAHQLNGVTMSEPGVSRLVAVDIQEAVELASA